MGTHTAFDIEFLSPATQKPYVIGDPLVQALLKDGPPGETLKDYCENYGSYDLTAKKVDFECKWYSFEDDFLALSKKHPEVLIHVTSVWQGDDFPKEEHYFLADKQLTQQWIKPKFNLKDLK